MGRKHDIGAWHKGTYLIYMSTVGNQFAKVDGKIIQVDGLWFGVQRRTVEDKNHFIYDAEGNVSYKKEKIYTVTELTTGLSINILYNDCKTLDKCIKRAEQFIEGDGLKLLSREEYKRVRRLCATEYEKYLDVTKTYKLLWENKDFVEAACGV